MVHAKTQEEWETRASIFLKAKMKESEVTLRRVGEAPEKVRLSRN